MYLTYLHFLMQIRYKPHDTNKLPMGEQRAPSLSNSNDLFSSVSNAASDMLNSEGILRGDNGLSSPGAVYEASSATGAGTMGSSFGNATNNMEPSMSFSPNVGASPGMMINKSEREMAMTTPLVFPEDKPYATAFSYHLLSQMQPCVFTEADRLGKRKGLPPGFPGLACRHCFGKKRTMITSLLCCGRAHVSLSILCRSHAAQLSHID